MISVKPTKLIDSVPEIPFESIKKGEYIGRGAYATVMKVDIPKSLIDTSSNSNQWITVAVKNISVQGENEEKLIQSFRAESKILRF